MRPYKQVAWAADHLLNRKPPPGSIFLEAQPSVGLSTSLVQHFLLFDADRAAAHIALSPSYSSHNLLSLYALLS
jgi:hypothetical protein